MPTTNYSFPTISDTDRIDGVSAINGLAQAVDTSLKQVADSIPSGGGGDYTAGNGITISGSTISVSDEYIKGIIDSYLAAGTTWSDINTHGFVYKAQ